MNIPKITDILTITQETDTITTLTFTYTKPIEPGQFLMIWIPGIDEIPMSISATTTKTAAITFRNIGDATNALAHMRIGDKIGVRGPYGNGFQLQGKRLLFIGGGTGIATLAPAVTTARSKGIMCTVILGVKTKQDLFFEQKFKKLHATVEIATDDGSQGYHGYASDLAAELLQKHTYDGILTCGPELMMKKILDIPGTIPLQASLERYMKCAIGVCGQCCIGEGLRVCKEGPVFDGKTLKTIEDFGVFRRDSAGRIISF
jgi:dihydroorotate dehydrogenase electron transfer subunit